MSDQTEPQSNPKATPIPPQGILHQTLGELLQHNKQAQNLIMHAMGLTPEKFQEMLNSTTTNPMMNQTIGELFKNGTMQQAAQQGGQVSPQQMQQIVDALNSQDQQIQGVIPGETVSKEPIPPDQPVAQVPKLTFLQKVKNLFH